MMARLKRILAAAAVLIVGGLSVNQALRDANQADAEPFAAEERDRVIGRLKDGRAIQAFIAVQDGFTVPEAIGNRILGECSAGSCSVGPYAYSYTRSPAVAGWRLVEIEAHPWVVGGWKQAAAANNEMVFWGARKDVVAACQASPLTNGQCLSLLQSLGDCWYLPADGSLCRNGLLYSATVGGTQPCAVTAAHRWFDCTAPFGADPVERSTVAAIPDDAQLDIDPPEVE